MNFTVNLLDENTPQYENEINNSTSFKLKHHQLSSLKKCVDLENVGLNNLYSERYEKVFSNIGILSDNVGSGKSFVILAILLVNETPLVNFKRTHVYGFDNIYIEYPKKRDEVLNLSVIVCPFGIVDQWEGYLKSFHSFNYAKINRTSLLESFLDSYMNYEVLLLSGTFYKYIADFFIENNIKVKRVIFDEADNASTPNARTIDALFYWFVTTSYKNLLYPYPVYTSYNVVENNMQVRRRPQMVSTGVLRNTFVKTLFVKLLREMPDHDMRSVYHELVVKNTNSYIDSSFQLPIVENYYIECTDNLMNILHGVMNNNTIISAMNAGDIKSALNALNKNNKGDETQIINLVKRDLDINLQNCLSKINYNKSLIVQNEDQQKEKIKDLEEEASNIRMRIQLLEERIKNSTMCVICYTSPPAQKTLTSCCKHTFCFTCICKYISKYDNRCPMCRTEITRLEDSLMVIGSEESDQSMSEERVCMSKFDTLSQLMQHFKRRDEKMKVLIFSGFDGSFEHISTVLTNNDLEYGILQGVGLQKTYKRFKKHDSNLDVLMINSYSFGSGLNLENTTDIILFHNFDEQIENQVIGRGQRPGRTSSLRVWYLLNENEMKENKKIYKYKKFNFTFE